MSTDLLIGPVWFGVNLLLVRGVWGFCRDLFPHEEGLSRVLHTAIVCWACIAGIGTLLGALNILTAPTLLAGATALAAALSFKDIRLSLVRRLAGSRSVLPGHHKDEGAVVAGAGEAPGGDRETSYSAKRNRWVEACWSVFWCAVLAFWTGRVVLGGLLELPVDWDTLMYHIPLVDNFLQTRGLYSRDCAVWYNPSNNELFGLWMAAPFSGDFLAALTNLPAGIIFVLATIELGRQLGLRGSLCHLTALAALANFAVVRQLLDVSNDVPAAGFVLAALCYALRYARTSYPADLLFASICLGLGAGIKYYALGSAAVAGAALVLAALLLRGPRPAGRVLVVGLMGTLLGGGFWYLRNALLTGQPLYPKGLAPANDPLLELYPQPWRSTLLGSGRPDVLPLLEKALWQFAGPCHYLALVLLPVSALGLMATGLVDCARGRKVEGIHRLILCFALVGSGLTLGVTPFAAETLPGSLNMLLGGYSPVRFGLCFYTLTLLALAVLLQDLSRAFAVFLGWVAAKGFRPSLSDPLLSRAGQLLTALLTHLPQATFAGLVLYQVYTVFQRPLPGNLLTAALVGADLFLAGWVVRFGWLAWPGLRWGLGVILAVGCCAAAGWATDALSLRWHDRFAAHYDRLLHTKTFSKLARLDPATTRLCALSYRYYPLLGSNRQFRVCQPKRVPNLPGLLEYLRARDLTMIAVLNVDSFEMGPYRDKREWLRQNPRLFSLLHADQTLSLFWVNRSALEEALKPRPWNESPARQQPPAEGQERGSNSPTARLHRN